MVHNTVAEIGSYHLSQHRTRNQKTDAGSHGVGAIEYGACQLIKLALYLHRAAYAAARIGFVQPCFFVSQAQVGYKLFV